MAETALEKREMQIGNRGLELRSLEDGYRFAELYVKSGLAPKGDTPAAVCIKLQKALELGVPMTAGIDHLAVINGKTFVEGIILGGLVERYPHHEFKQVDYSGSGDKRSCTVTMKRKDRPNTQSVTFSMDDAKRHGLLGKDNWKKDPDMMLYWRAFGRCCRMVYPELTIGCYLTEEMPEIIDVTDSVKVTDPPKTLDQDADNREQKREEEQADQTEMVAAFFDFKVGDAVQWQKVDGGYGQGTIKVILKNGIAKLEMPDGSKAERALAELEPVQEQELAFE